MARFDVHRNPAGSGFLLDCQADILSSLNTRLVVPLLPRDEAPRASERLNPFVEVEGETLVMMTHFAASIPERAMGERVASLEEEHDLIINAFDMLLTGY